jgi:hypothetical protein
MAKVNDKVRVGDVLAVRTKGRPAWWIRFGSAVADKPDLSNHIAVVHHIDFNGTVWVIEGKPGGVGWRDASAYLADKHTITNIEQPKTDVQRQGVADTMQALLKTDYDWEAIVMDGLSDVGIKIPDWSPTWKGTVPAHVVCSSVAAYSYAKNGLSCPAGDRGVQPSDWDEFILTKGWETIAPKKKIYGD